MNAKVFACATVLGSTLMLVTVGRPVSAAALYSVSRLPFIPSDINDRGQVVGQQYLWDNGSVTDLSTLPGASGNQIAAKAVNNQGLIVGGGLTVNRSTIYQQTVPDQAFRSDGKTISDLGTVGFLCKDSCVKTNAIDLNNQGQIAFNTEYQDYQGGVSPYVQQPDGSFNHLFSSRAIAINNAGEVLSYTIARGRSGPSRGAIANGNSTTVLMSPGYCFSFSTPCFSESTYATDINDKGQVVGYGPLTSDRGSPLEAMLWKDPQTETIAEGLKGLGGTGNLDYRGKIASLANSLNDAGEVVGLSYKSSGEQRAVFWKDAAFADLNELISTDSGWSLTEAIKINNQGQIVGKGYLDGKEQGFLLTLNPDAEPIPEPDSPIALWAGAGILGTTIGLRRRRSGVKKV
jgi:probable HAF family extracellular repeat protein